MRVEEDEVDEVGMKEEEHGDWLLAVVVYGEVLEMGRYDWRTVYWWDWAATWVPAQSPSCKPERLREEEGRVGRRREEGRVERRRREEGRVGRRRQRRKEMYAHHTSREDGHTDC